MSADKGVIEEALGAQGEIQPGEQGWWQVWGARAQHIKVGDLVMAKWTDTDTTTEHEVVSIESHMCGIRVVDQSGQRMLFGFLQPIVVLRQGTHHTLA